jgi:hypothetical protein
MASSARVRKGDLGDRASEGVASDTWSGHHPQEVLAVCGTDPGYSAREKMMKNHGLISSFFVMFCAFFMRAICVNADFVKMHVGDAGMLPSGTSSFPRGYESTPVQLRARRDPFRLPDARNIGLTPSARNSLPIN